MEETREDGSPSGQGGGGGAQPRPSAVVRAIEAAKRRPVVVVAVTLVAVITFFTTTWGLIRGAVDIVDEQVNPHRELYAQLDKLELDATPEFVDRALGTPDSVVDPGLDCEGCDALSLRIYRLEDMVTVRALFDGSTLGMFLVTRVDPEANPQIRWQRTGRGALGEVSFAEASALGGEESLTPTDVALWPGVQRITYLEVFALGAPGNYEGLLLGHTTEGASGTPFDIEDAQGVADAYEADTPAGLPAGAAEFRRTSRPNSYGAFRDDGLIGQLVRDADFAATMQIAGTFT